MKLVLLGAVLACLAALGRGQYYFYQQQCDTRGKAPAEASCCDSSSDSTQGNQNCCMQGGSCYCSTSQASPTCFGMLPVTAANVSQCCGRLKERVFRRCYFSQCNIIIRTVYEYYYTYFERMGFCRRNPSVTFTRPQTKKPDPLPGPCYCKQEATSCFAPTTAATTTTTTSTTTTTTTTTESTTTPTTTSTSTTTPTTTSTSTTTPTTTSTSTTTPTTTSTTTTPPTTTPPPVCPTPPEVSFARVFGGNPVGDTCAVSGMLNFRFGSTQMCNGVLGYDYATQSNQMFITNFCIGFLKALGEVQPVTTFGLYNLVPFQITDATVTTLAADQISKMEPPPGVLSDSRCKTTACVYSPATMSSLIDFNTCYFTSFGYDIMVAGTYFNSGTVNRVNVTKQATCTTISVSPNAECFHSVNTNVRGCWGDNGAPVFCRLTSTQETVLYGLLDVIGQPPKEITGSDPLNMCADSNEFHVLPIS